ncbi:sensor histidine kinase [Microbacterium sp.]|uniref:sensor histidine kinase n=1 Tax=Microbacterium sp. TaxID=51671 RepID=UPI00262AEEE7|nr:sensor histidine kinase [Microbacterium sp.]
MSSESAREADGVRTTASVPPPAGVGNRRATDRGSRSVWERYGWLMAVIWLVFLVYPIMALTRSQAAQGWIITGWVALVAFIVVYVAGFVNGMSRDGGGLTTPPKPIQWCAFAGLIVLGALTIPSVGGNALSFIPFIMSFASYGLTRPAHWITMAAGIAVTASTVLLLPGWITYVSVLVIVVMLAVVNTVSTTLIIHSEHADRLSLELATSEGREAVARDVHDLIGHSLTVVRMKAQLARRLMDADPERAKAELVDIEDLTAEAIAGVRATVAGVRSAELADQLESCRSALSAADVEFRVEGTLDALSPAQALTASWILREAVTNVLRHAHASAVTVRIAPGRFAVIDDGVGMSRRTGDEGSGIRGMRERASTGGGVLSAVGPADGGTHVEVAW